ncbi:MAG: M15 family metallopeptidase [Treponema sp.]|jgi:hypothetical protein|nr:M15 family metallopeptidase [Treponema sp.]
MRRCALVFMLTLWAVFQSAAQSAERPEQVMKALSQAYPGRVSQAVRRNGDWAVQVYGQWFYYAQGRLLPEALRTKAEEYDGQPFYNYSTGMPVWKEPTAEQNERFRNMSQRRHDNPPKRSQHFYDALWRASTRDESYRRQKSIHFLGHTIMAHYTILEELALVEERLQTEAQTNAQVRTWVANLKSASAWSWRSIADTESRSFHAYGAAIDLQVANPQGLETYWLWTQAKNPNWWAVPYSKRLHPPAAVIKAFEDYGFIWGGKWPLYDTMHFEYRPEILILNGMKITPSI